MIRGAGAVLLCLFAGVCDGGAYASDDQPITAGLYGALAGIQASRSGDGAELTRRETLLGIYAQRGFRPFWSRNGAWTPQALELLRTFRTAEQYGLRSQDYALNPDPAELAALSEAHPEFKPKLEVAVSAAVLRLLTHVHFGRIDPRAVGFNLEDVRPGLDFGALLAQLETAADVDRVISAVEPQFYHYQLLRRALARYQLLASRMATPTAAELSTAPFARRVRQIELTLERWRWLPAFTSPPIIVNIPQFRLFAFQSTQDRKAEILQMDVIVGRAYPRLQTPVFAADMTYVVFRPYWDVPYSITQREMLPEIRAKPDYLRKQHLEIVSGAGDSATVVPPTAGNIQGLASGALRLRQQPAGDNALGLIKFMLPNTYNVYLHSTPAHALFRRSRRAFSHGCIRVSDPVALAAFVLRNAGGGWTVESITAAMNAAVTRRVNLAKPIRVLIVYGTALATEDGPVLFFDDLYGHDRRLEKLLGLSAVAGG